MPQTSPCGQKMSTGFSRIVCFVALTWGTSVAVGLVWLGQYQTTPTPGPTVSSEWPADVDRMRDESRPTIVLFAHPQCPCTRAAVRELDRICVSGETRATIETVFVRPESVESGWERTALWEFCEKAELNPTVDRAGRLAETFQATVSGEAFVYATDGRLLFHGSITRGRGHEGENPGIAAVRDVLNGDSPSTQSTPLFGCPLRSPEQASVCTADALSDGALSDGVRPDGCPLCDRK